MNKNESRVDEMCDMIDQVGGVGEEIGSWLPMLSTKL